MKLSPEVLEEALQLWITPALQLVADESTLRSVAFDGKSLCGMLCGFKTLCGMLRFLSAVHLLHFVHLLAAADQQTGCVLLQVAVDHKSYELRAALELLHMPVSQGRPSVSHCTHAADWQCEAIRISRPRDESGIRPSRRCHADELVSRTRRGDGQRSASCSEHQNGRRSLYDVCQAMHPRTSPPFAMPP